MSIYTRETYRLVENIHPYTPLNTFSSTYTPCIQLPIILTQSLSFFHASAYYSTSLLYISLFLFIFHLFSHDTLLLVHIQPYHPTTPIHLSLSSSYKVHSNNTCISVSTSPQPHLQPSYFHVILSLPLTGKHHPLTISRTVAAILPSAKLSFLGISFIRTYSFSLSVSLKPFFHAFLSLSCILSQIYFFLDLPFHSHSLLSDR